MAIAIYFNGIYFYVNHFLLQSGQVELKILYLPELRAILSSELQHTLHTFFMQLQACVV